MDNDPSKVAEKSNAQRATDCVDDIADSKEKYSLNSTDSDTNQASPSKSKRFPAERKMNRILANRKSARKSRERRKKLQDDLQSSAVYLTEQNNTLKQANGDLSEKIRLLTRLLNLANNQSLVEGVSNNLGGASFSQVNSQLATGGTTDMLSLISSVPPTPAIDMNNIGVLRAIASMRQVQGRQVQRSTPLSDIVAALLDQSLHSTAVQRDQNNTMNFLPRDNRWGSK